MQSNTEQHSNDMYGYSKLRSIKLETLKKLDCFMVPDNYVLTPEEVKLDLRRMLGRFCYPVKNSKGDIIGIVGYDKFDSAKYVDSIVTGYKAKTGGFLGMEFIEQYYHDKTKMVYITEGAVCYAWLIEYGEYALSSLGSNLTEYQVQILKRFGPRACIVPDNDRAGDKYMEQIRKVLPKASIFRVTGQKDIDDMRKENEELLKQKLKRRLV